MARREEFTQLVSVQFTLVRGVGGVVVLLVECGQGGQVLNGWDMALARGHHARAHSGSKNWDRVLRLCPSCATIFVTLMITEEVTYAVWAEVCRSVGPLCAGHDDGVGDDCPIGADPSLQVAQHELPTADMIRVVTQRLHDLAPRQVSVAGPTRVGVELLPVAYEGLHEVLLAGTLESPHLRLIDLNQLVYQLEAVPLIDKVQRLLHDLDVGREEGIFENAPSLEDLANACLPRAPPFKVLSLIHIAERASSINAIPVDGSPPRVVLTSGSWTAILRSLQPLTTPTTPGHSHPLIPLVIAVFFRIVHYATLRAGAFRGRPTHAMVATRADPGAGASMLETPVRNQDGRGHRSTVSGAVTVEVKPLLSRVSWHKDKRTIRYKLTIETSKHSIVTLLFPSFPPCAHRTQKRCGNVGVPGKNDSTRTIFSQSLTFEKR